MSVKIPRAGHRAYRLRILGGYGVLSFLLTVTGTARATHTLDYLVYVEHQYFQGDLKSADLLDDHEGRFLLPVHYSELFGTLEEDVYLAILKRLKEQSPQLYRHVRLSLPDGGMLATDTAAETLTVELPSSLAGHELSRVLHEVTASLLSYGSSRAVDFRMAGQGRGNRIWTMDSLRVPVFRLHDLSSVGMPVSRPERVIWVRDTVTVPLDSRGDRSSPDWVRLLRWIYFGVLSVAFTMAAFRVGARRGKSCL